ncbi:MAG: CO2 hydration protein [Synechococcales cyanobacterium T60_A2020_003]|nr:CO2 hydration protein [Synechococcales cyanobacterium T60_A2020_003]
MLSLQLEPSKHPLAEYIYEVERGNALLADSSQNLLEVVGVLKSYGVVLDAYSRNLIYIADHQFLRLFPFFKYFNGDVSIQKLLKHWWHDRINYEYAEYCMRSMMWHGGGKLDTYVDSPEFLSVVEELIQNKLRVDFILKGLHRLFPEFLPEQMRMMAYYSALGQFWRVMSDAFISLSEEYDAGRITSIPQVVDHILNALVANANNPITYSVSWRGKTYTLIPESAGITFLMDTAVPYVEAVFLRGTPFLGTVSYNAQAYQIPLHQSDFAYGALYADPLPTGSSGIPPTLLMQDMRHYLPDYLHRFYQDSLRQEDDLKVKICQSFQKSMFCVTTAAIRGLAPFPLDTADLEERRANRAYLETWMNRLLPSQLIAANA